jgi:hypothetical protein
MVEKVSDCAESETFVRNFGSEGVVEEFDGVIEGTDLADIGSLSLHLVSEAK